MEFADDTTVVGLLSNWSQVVYRDEVQSLSEWCSHNNLCLKLKKQNKGKLIIDFRRRRGKLRRLELEGEEVERLLCF